MNNRIKWTAEQVEEYYEKNIKPVSKAWYFPSYTKLAELWFLGFYVVLFNGKVDKYPNVEAFCKAYNLKRDSQKVNKWTKEYADNFYLKNIKPNMENDIFPKIDWFREKKWEYTGFLAAINNKKVEWYTSLEDFKLKNNIFVKKSSNITKEYIDQFYKDNIEPYVVDRRMPTAKWIKSKWSTYSSWYQYIYKYNVWYNSLRDFCSKNHLIAPWRRVWDRITADNFFKEQIKPLMNWNKLLSYKDFKEIDWKYLEWYNAIRNSRVDWYSWIKEFKLKNKLK